MWLTLGDAKGSAASPPPPSRVLPSGNRPRAARWAERRAAVRVSGAALHRIGRRCGAHCGNVARERASAARAQAGGELCRGVGPGARGSRRAKVGKPDYRKVTNETRIAHVETGPVRPVVYLGRMAVITLRANSSTLLRLLRRFDAVAARLPGSGQRHDGNVSQNTPVGVPSPVTAARRAPHRRGWR